MEFQEIYKEFHPKILYYIAKVRGTHEAEDITQEVFEKVNRGLDGFKGESKLSTWIYRIATNTALDKLRSSSYKHSSKHTSLQETAQTEDLNTLTGQTDPSLDEQVIRKEMNDCVREYIDKLPPDYRSVLILSEIEGFKNREIATILEISLENVKVRLHRARASLKKELDKGCDFYHNEKGTLACDRKPIVIESKKS